MNLIEKIKSDIKIAMIEKDNFKRDKLRLITSAIKQIEVDSKKKLTDLDVENIIMKMIKQRKDSIAQFIKAKREDLVKIEKDEIDIIKNYLPKQLDIKELEVICTDIAKSISATAKDMGKVIKLAKDKIGSKADGKTISDIVKKTLMK